MKPAITLIHADNFAHEVIDEEKPLLLLCMTMDGNYKHQLDLIEKISLNYNEIVKFGLLEDAFLAVFKKIYKVVGTPTFLLMSEGEERKRFLGLADEQSLTEFISSVVEQQLALTR